MPIQCVPVYVYYTLHLNLYFTLIKNKNKTNKG